MRTGVGALDKRIDLEKQVHTPDGGGGYTSGWEKQKTVWANIEPLTASEQFSAQQVQGKTNYAIKIRYRKDLVGILLTEWRIRYGAQLFDEITGAIDEDMRHRYLILTCTESPSKK